MSETDSATAAEGTGTQAETTREATPSIEWMRDFARRWTDAWNSHEVDQVLALMTEDVEYRDDAWPKPMRGHADVREFLEASWRAFPDMTFELLSGPYVIPGEPRAAFQWRGRATHTARSTRLASRPPAAAGSRTVRTFRSIATVVCARCGSRSTC